jgi:hypothetical protein
MPVIDPLETMLQDIERALNASLHYLALVMALTMPGICAALEEPSGSTSGRDSKAYMDWYSTNIGTLYPNLTGVDCYSLRCGVVHQGRFGDPNKMQYGRVLFTVPNVSRNVFHNNILNDALNLDTEIFCRDMMNSVRNWYCNRPSNSVVHRNIDMMVRLRPEGLAPYMVGIPLIA